MCGGKDWGSGFELKPLPYRMARDSGGGGGTPWTTCMHHSRHGYPLAHVPHGPGVAWCDHAVPHITTDELQSQ